jgi:hypothetical protein
MYVFMECRWFSFTGIYCVISISIALIIYYFFMMRTFKILSSCHFEVFNALLLNIITLCNRTPELICPKDNIDQSFPIPPPGIILSLWHHNSTLLWDQHFIFHIWVRLCSICLFLPGLSHLIQCSPSSYTLQMIEFQFFMVE